MRLRIRGHPADRMRERQITEDDIENAIANHHTSYESGSDAIVYNGPGMNGADLKVVAMRPGYVDDMTTIVIKTVAWRGTA